MRQLLWLALLVIFFMAFAHTFRSTTTTGPKTVHIVLIGASIGQSWRLAEWPARMGSSTFTAESLQAWRFDKSEAIQTALLRPRVKFTPSSSFVRSLFDPPPIPRVVILKECSSYFPGDLNLYRESLRNWVNQLNARKLRIVLATVVPVTKARADRDHGKQESLTGFNRWVREYAAQHNLPLLDLDVALRAGGEGSFLREEFASEDGSHLLPAAYAVLDRTLLATLSGIRI
jgi:hypothetical protein